jgi:hypothetical protein
MSLHNACCVKDVQITMHVLKASLLSHGHWCGGLNSEQVTTRWGRGVLDSRTLSRTYISPFSSGLVNAQSLHSTSMHCTQQMDLTRSWLPSLSCNVNRPCWILHTEVFLMQNLKHPLIKLYPVHCPGNCAIVFFADLTDVLRKKKMNKKEKPYYRRCWNVR